MEKYKNSSWLSLGVSVSYCYLSGSLLHAVETWTKNGVVLYAVSKVLMLLFQMKLNSDEFGKLLYSIKGCHLVAALTESLKSHCMLHYNSCRIKVRVTFFFQDNSSCLLLTEVDMASFWVCYWTF